MCCNIKINNSWFLHDKHFVVRIYVNTRGSYYIISADNKLWRIESAKSNATASQNMFRLHNTIIIIKFISDKTLSIYIYTVHKTQLKKYEKYNTYNTIKAMM